jgi:hypothetical protein
MMLGSSMEGLGKLFLLSKSKFCSAVMKMWLVKAQQEKQASNLQQQEIFDLVFVALWAPRSLNQP